MNHAPPHRGSSGHRGGGFRPQRPPEKSDTGLVGLIVALVVLAAGAVAITGFWQPGFFLDDERAGRQEDATDPDRHGREIDDAEQVKRVARQAARSVNTRDESLAVRITCEAKQEPDFSKMPPDMHASVIGEPTMDGLTKAKITVRFTAHGRSEEEALRLEKREGRWCIN